jgi:hypothetical protein
LTSGITPDQPHPQRRVPDQAGDELESKTSIIRRHPTGSFPALAAPSLEEAATSYFPSRHPTAVVSPRAIARPHPGAASATATVSIISGWATAVIATSLIAGWWRTDQLFCVAIGFLTAVSAAATIGGLISLLLRRRIGRVLIVVGSVVAVMIFAGLFVAGAKLPPLVYAIPILPVASVALALLPATGRWCA